MAEKVAKEVGLADRLHLWPDKALKTQAVLAAQDNPLDHIKWLENCWSRRSEWPDVNWRNGHE